MCQIIVSDVGRTISGSSALLTSAAAAFLIAFTNMSRFDGIRLYYSAGCIIAPAIL